MMAEEWKQALEQCLRTKRYGIVDCNVALVYVDGSRVFYAAQSLVSSVGRATNSSLPIVAVFRLHPQIAQLLRSLAASKGSAWPEEVDMLLSSVIFRDQSSTNTSSDTDWIPAIRASPDTWPCAVNVEGGGLVLYGDSEEKASEALTMMALAMIHGDDRLADSETEPFVAVVEHRDGYVGRELSQATSPRVICIRRQDWNGASTAQTALDDALVEYETSFREEQEINGDDIRDELSLEIDVAAAFEVRDQVRRSLETTFLLDSDTSSSAPASPAIVLYSTWSGLENVRSLLCNPPPHSASTLCFDDSTNSPADPGARESLNLLEEFQRALVDGNTSHSWGLTSDTSQSLAEVTGRFKRLLTNIGEDQDDSVGASVGDEDNTNNTIETTVSMALNAERQRGIGSSTRKEMDPVEKVWDFLTRHVHSAEIALQIVHELVVYLSNTHLFPTPHTDNNTALANLIRSRHDEVHASESVSTPFASGAQQLLSDPTRVIASLVEAGDWKMMRDVLFCLTQAGFSSHEATEIVQAMPRFDIQDHCADRTLAVKWMTMDHVLQLCASGRAIQLPVAFMRKAIHDCVAKHAHRVSTESIQPTISIDLQSFIPDRLRANIADPIHWTLRMAFNCDYEHRLKICQDAAHPTVRSHQRSLFGGVDSSNSDLALDDTTLQAIKTALSKHPADQHPEVVKFITKLDELHETRLHQDLHDIQLPAGMSRYDCCLRRVKTT